MKILLNPIFIICCVLFVLHLTIERWLELHFRFIDNYLDNLLSVPILLTLVVAERRILFKKGDDYRLDIMETLAGTIVISLVGELLFTRLSPKFTFDWTDFIFYFAGAIIFYVGINRQLKYNNNSTKN